MNGVEGTDERSGAGADDEVRRQAGRIEHFEGTHVGPALDTAGAEDQRQSRPFVSGG
jgi:hypothetical protein